mmetsp:Transcript_1281/g.2776  ORF Transcript_1281/g.2776 Transcript_1281/m.2776 type:complete len:93 (+) Transcript_1281:280-558(+)
MPASLTRELKLDHHHVNESHIGINNENHFKRNVQQSICDYIRNHNRLHVMSRFLHPNSKIGTWDPMVELWRLWEKMSSSNGMMFTGGSPNLS